MSVQACSRATCGNCMCRRLSHEYGYICNECFEELLKNGIQTNIRTFMESIKPSFDHSPEQIKSFFDMIFPLVGD